MVTSALPTSLLTAHRPAADAERRLRDVELRTSPIPYYIAGAKRSRPTPCPLAGVSFNHTTLSYVNISSSASTSTPPRSPTRRCSPSISTTPSGASAALTADQPKGLSTVPKQGPVCTPRAGSGPCPRARGSRRGNPPIRGAVGRPARSSQQLVASSPDRPHRHRRYGQHGRASDTRLFLVSSRLVTGFGRHRVDRSAESLVVD